MQRILHILAALSLLVAGMGIGLTMRFAPAAAQGGTRYFPETGHTVQGRFLEYWTANGGLAQQGYPLTEEIQEVSDLDGMPYTVQYFERAVFEKHPEKARPYDVLLSQLGRFRYQAKYGNGGGLPAPVPPAATQPPAPPPASGKQTFSGHGSSTTQPFQLKAGALRYHATHNGGSNFIVHLLAPNGSISQFLVNEIGPVDQSRVVNIPATGMFLLDVDADGDWVVELQQ
jgi:hypothetical protein